MGSENHRRELTEREKLEVDLQQAMKVEAVRKGILASARRGLDTARSRVKEAEDKLAAVPAEIRAARAALAAYDAAAQQNALPVLSIEDENRPRKPGDLPAATLLKP